MEKSRRIGVVICVGTALIVVAFIWGIALRNYWAVAIPVVVGFLAVLSLGFWIGWTMAVTEIEMPKPELTEESAPSEAQD